MAWRCLGSHHPCVVDMRRITPTTCQAFEQAMHGAIAHPHFSSLHPLPNALLGSGMEVLISVPYLTPPSCSQSEKGNPTPTACQALEQATRGNGIFPPHQPWLPSLQPQQNPLHSTGMEPFSPRCHSSTTPVISSSHKDVRSLSPGSEEANFHQSCSTHLLLLTYRLT